MKHRISHELRRCENPDCRVLFHPPRETSRFCRACSTVKRLYSKQRPGAAQEVTT